ncbi:hypothetical protein A2U01_0095651, partial [Trifolium medium]|nr:hypothetical protein [Trifolium medium]
RMADYFHGSVLTLMDVEKQEYQDDFRRPNKPAHVIIKMAMKIDRCEQTHLNGWPRPNDTVFIGWKQPREG